jgi:hypothetical protein
MNWGTSFGSRLAWLQGDLVRCLELITIDPRSTILHIDLLWDISEFPNHVVIRFAKTQGARLRQPRHIPLSHVEIVGARNNNRYRHPHLGTAGVDIALLPLLWNDLQSESG